MSSMTGKHQTAYQKQRAREANLKHGDVHRVNGRSVVTTEYRIWSLMKDRCSNPNTPCFKHYGGRGIKVCERWLSYENFLADMGRRPEGTSLDRIDVDGDYEPKNVRWSTTKTQSRNKRGTIRVDYLGQRKSLIDWCEEFGLSYNLIRQRMYRDGKTFEQAIRA